MAWRGIEIVWLYIGAGLLLFVAIGVFSVGATHIQHTLTLSVLEKNYVKSIQHPSGSVILGYFSAISGGGGSGSFCRFEVGEVRVTSLDRESIVQYYFLQTFKRSDDELEKVAVYFPDEWHWLDYRVENWLEEIPVQSATGTQVYYVTAIDDGYPNGYQAGWDLRC